MEAFYGVECRNVTATSGYYRKKRSALLSQMSADADWSGYERVTLWGLMFLETWDLIYCCRSASQYALSTKLLQLAYFGLCNFMVTRGLYRGFRGFRVSTMPASRGVLPPFRTLQATQAQTILSHVVGPPLLFGINPVFVSVYISITFIYSVII